MKKLNMRNKKLIRKLYLFFCSICANALENERKKYTSAFRKLMKTFLPDSVIY